MATFVTERFNITVTKETFLNRSCHGDDLAAWLGEEFCARPQQACTDHYAIRFWYQLPFTAFVGGHMHFLSSLFGAKRTLRTTADNPLRLATDLIKAAQAYIAVIASENSGESYSNAIKPRKDWHANVTMVLDRKGDNLARFFEKIFVGMFEGRSMLNLWVELTPQGHGPWQAEAPGTMLLRWRGISRSND
jgi:hypothetical protein